MRENQLKDIVKQFRQIYAERGKAGKWTIEQRERCDDLLNQHKRLEADIEAAKGKHEQFLKMISPDSKDKPRQKR